MLWILLIYLVIDLHYSGHLINIILIKAPGMDEQRDMMRASAKKKEGQRHALPPQLFNGEKYCGVRNKILLT